MLTVLESRFANELQFGIMTSKHPIFVLVKPGCVCKIWLLAKSLVCRVCDSYRNCLNY